MQYFARYPADQARLRELARHLAGTDERLPTGERLTARRLRQVGIRLGADLGFDALHYLFEDPFVTVGGTRRLSRAFLADVGALVSYAGRELYAVLHEAIYAQGAATHWAAQRVRGEFPTMAEDADPAWPGTPVPPHRRAHLPLAAARGPGARPARGAADLLAAKDDFPALYDRQALSPQHRPGGRGGLRRRHVRPVRAVPRDGADASAACGRG